MKYEFIKDKPLPKGGLSAAFQAEVDAESRSLRAENARRFPDYTPDAENPLFAYQQEILARPPEWQASPNSANLCHTLRQKKKYRNVYALPPEAFEPSEAERKRSEQASAEYDKRWRNERAKERYRRDMDATRKVWRDRAAANRADPVKGPKLREYNRKWRHTPKGKAADERHRERRNAQKRERYANDAEYHEAKKKQARDAYREKYRNNPEFRKAQQARARNRKRAREKKRKKNVTDTTP